MTTYPDFIENAVESYFRERGKLRWECFEQEGYRSLMSVLENTTRNPYNSLEETFMYYTDIYILLKYITNVNMTSMSENLMNTTTESSKPLTKIRIIVNSTGQRFMIISTIDETTMIETIHVLK